jgi:hypothetical protein
MTARRVLDFAIYVCVGLVLVLAIAWGAVWADSPSSWVFGRWVGLAVNTLIVFGCTVRDNASSLRRPSLLALLAALLAVHVSAFVVLLERVPEWGLGWWLFLTPTEYFAIGAILVLAGRRSNGPRRRI